jgi:diaminohydroxyphosphoribosylaminopyrimidine deaminase / 5-amino-6-(5-phosphoribosylamino)uracil reductase
MPTEQDYIRLAIQLARRGSGATSPNPMVGAVLVKQGKIIGRGWHRRAGEPHAEIEALRDAEVNGANPSGATLYATLEPCCTHGRTPPCTQAILRAGIRKVVVGTADPNPLHHGRGLSILEEAGIKVVRGVLEDRCRGLNQAFNHWIVHRRPFVTVKAAMTLDGKIATASGESKWLTGERARAWGMRLRQGADAILVGINTVLADDPSLTFRPGSGNGGRHRLQRIILDSHARTPLSAKVVNDDHAVDTTIVVAELAHQRRVQALSERVRVLVAPLARQAVSRKKSAVPAKVDLAWLLEQLGAAEVTSLLVEGGGEVNASFLLARLADRVAFFYGPKVLGGRDSRPAVGGTGTGALSEILQLEDVRWRRLGPDLLLTAAVVK